MINKQKDPLLLRNKTFKILKIKLNQKLLEEKKKKRKTKKIKEEDEEDWKTDSEEEVEGKVLFSDF